MKLKRAWLYCRLAHNGSDSAELLAKQRNRLEVYAKEYGFEIVGVSNDLASGLTMGRPSRLGFHTAVINGDVEMLLVDLTRLGRGTDGVSKYWHHLRNLGVSVHTADCGEADLSIPVMFYGTTGGDVSNAPARVASMAFIGLRKVKKFLS